MQEFTGTLDVGDTVLFKYPGWVCPVCEVEGIIRQIIKHDEGKGKKKKKQVLYKIEFVHAGTGETRITTTVRLCIIENRGKKVYSGKRKFTSTRRTQDG